MGGNIECQTGFIAVSWARREDTGFDKLESMIHVTMALISYVLLLLRRPMQNKPLFHWFWIFNIVVKLVPRIEAASLIEVIVTICQKCSDKNCNSLIFVYCSYTVIDLRSEQWEDSVFQTVDYRLKALWIPWDAFQHKSNRSAGGCWLHRWLAGSSSVHLCICMYLLPRQFLLLSLTL